METKSNPLILFYSENCFHESLRRLAQKRHFTLQKVDPDHLPDEKKLENYLKIYLVDNRFLDTIAEKFGNFYKEVDDPFHQIILLTDNSTKINPKFPKKFIANVFSLPINESNEDVFSHIIFQAFNSLRKEAESFDLQKRLLNRTHQLQEITQIGIAMNTERDLDKLLALILDNAKKVSRADSGSLYLVEKDPGNVGVKKLRFKLSSMDIDTKEFTISIDHNSVAGYVALTGTTVNLEDAYYPPPESNFTINKSFDLESGYRTKSMVVLPMKNQKDEVIGVLQLINCKPSKNLLLEDPEHIEEVVTPFDDETIEVITAFAGQAAVSIENSNLYKSIQNLFEGFVTAAVTAIESRDPTTSGHSSRVAKLTVGLADALNRTSRGKYGNLNFSNDQILEIRYASLLHDFGKVGVREKVLVKAKKLYPFDLRRITERFQFIKRTVQKEFSQKKLNYILEKNREEELKNLGIYDQEEATKLAELDENLKFILKSNEPTVLESGSFEKILKIAELHYRDMDSNMQNFLTPEEINFLSIRKGSLNQDERMEIESHVTHTFKFLSQIPWTTELKNIPTIAYAHHERLTGDGYPNRLVEHEIPTQSKMMTISDIFDALTAADRPYKKAVPMEKALQILEFEVKDNHVDPELFKIFREAKIFDLVL